MIIQFSPQQHDVNTIAYEFSTDKIVATMGDITDEFNFSVVGDGELIDIITTLPLQPILEAKRVGGTLFMTLLNFYSDHNADDSIRFPKPFEVK